MIGYTTLGTNDLPRAVAFYDALLADLGGKRFMEFETFVAWGFAGGGAGFSVAKPYDGQPATVGNGCMIALKVDSPAMVDALHAKALQLGGRDEGAPGPRSERFYGGYFRDLDGNKLNFFCMT